MNVKHAIRTDGMVAVLLCIVLACSAAAKETLDVLSYNIHMWEPGVKALSDVIKTADPDIVGLNEAWSEKHNNQLANALDYRIVGGGQGVPGASPRRAHWVNDYYMPQMLLTSARS